MFGLLKGSAWFWVCFGVSGTNRLKTDVRDKSFESSFRDKSFGTGVRDKSFEHGVCFGDGYGKETIQIGHPSISPIRRKNDSKLLLSKRAGKKMQKSRFSLSEAHGCRHMSTYFSVLL